jgi:hypothetical protein
MPASSGKLLDYSMIKHLAQVFLDGELGGTPFQGSNLSTTVPFLTEFLAWLKKDHHSGPDQIIADLAKKSMQHANHTDINRLMTLTKNLVDLDAQVTSETPPLNQNTQSTKEQLLATLTTIGQKQLELLNKEDEIFLPGGWAGGCGTSGHQMIYRLIKDPTSGELQFLVYNSGAGIHYHGSIPRASGKPGYYPIYGMRFPATVLQQKEKLVRWIAKLLEPSALPLLDPNCKYTKQKLYDNLLRPSCAWLGGTKIPPEKLAVDPILSQRDGTCVLKALTLMLQSTFPDKNTFRQFWLAYRLYLLDQALPSQQLADLEQTFPGYKTLLKRCLANTVRMLDKNLKKGINECKLDHDTQKKILSLFEEWHATLNNTPTGKANSRVQTVDPTLAENEAKLTLEPCFVEPTIVIEAANQPLQATPEFVYAPESKSFLDALDELNQLSVPEERFCAVVEQFCFVFSDPAKSLLQGKEGSPEEQEQLLASMTKLFERYANCRGELTPRSVRIYLSLMLLMDRISAERFFKFENTHISCLPYYAQELFTLLKKIRANPCLASFDAKADILLQRILAFYNKHIHADSSNLALLKKTYQTYSQLIAQAPENERAIIEEKWAKEDSKDPALIKSLRELLPDNCLYVYSYLENEGSAVRRDDNKTPSLNKAFRCQEKQEHFLRNCLAKIVVYCYPSEERVTLPSWIKKDVLSPIIPKISISLEKIKYYYWSKPNTILFKETVHNSYSSKSNSRWFLKPEFLQQHFAFTKPVLGNALSSAYDGNPYSSQELAFNHQKTTFLPNHFVSAESRQRTESQRRPQLLRSAEERLENKLHQLAISSGCQVTLLLGELVHNPLWLMDEEFQEYVALRIFQPDALLSALQNAAEIWPTLERLLKQNRFNTDPSYPEKAESFLLKLGATMSAYALDAEKLAFVTLDAPSKAAALQWQQRLQEALKARLAKAEPSLAEQKENHSLRLLSLSCFPLATPEAASDLVNSYLSLMLLPDTEHVGHVLEKEKRQALLEKSCVLLQCYLRENQGFFEKLAAVAVQLVNSKGQWPGNWQHKPRGPTFPFVVVLEDNQGNHIKIDLVSRALIHNGENLSYLPLSCLLRPEYRDIFGMKPVLVKKNRAQTRVLSSVVSVSGDIYSWKHQGENYRLFKSDGVYLQKAMAGRWATLTAPSRAMAQQAGYSNYNFAFDNTTVPPLFAQPGYRLWVIDNKNYTVFDNHSGRVCYECKAGQLSKPPATTLNFFLSSPPPILLLRLEDKKFIESITQGNGTRVFHLPRYNLSFIFENGIFFTVDKLYRLELPQKAEDHFGTGLMLRAEQRDNEDHYLLPLQPFYQLDDCKQGACRESLHHPWVHDLANALPQLHFDKKNKEEPFYSRKSQGWDFTGSERCLQFSVKDGQYEARNAADQVSLAYLYLAQDRPKKALALLKACQFQGTWDEAERLWWILTKLPANSDKPLLNSRSLAVQMQALQALVSLTVGAPLVGTQNSPPKPSDTQWFREQEKGHLQEFLKNLPAHVEKLYATYDNRRNNIPQHLRLPLSQEKFLLSYAQAARDRAIQQKKQEQQKESLELKRTAENPLPRPYSGVLGTRYLEQFGAAVPTAQAVSYYPSQVEQSRQLTLSLNKEDKDYIWSSHNRISSKPSSQQAEAKLSPWISIEDFTHYYLAFYKMATGTSEKNELRLFCQALMTRLHCKQDKTPEDKTFIALISLLWAVIHDSRKIFYIADITKSPLLGDESSNFLNLVKSADVLLTQFPLTIIAAVTEERPLKCHSSPVATPANAGLSLLVEDKPLELLAKLPELSALKEKLTADETAYEAKREQLVDKLQTLPTLPLEEQSALFERLDAQLLAFKKEKQAAQLAAYEQYKQEAKQEPSVELQGLATEILQAKETLKAALEKSLAARTPPIIKEFGKQQTRPTVDSLIENFAKATTADYRALGFAEQNLPLLESQLQQWLRLANTERRLVALQKSLEEEKATSTPHTQQKVIKALIAKDEAVYKHEALFQYIQEIGLFPEQAELLSFLIKKHKNTAASYVLQLIMGGGKTKVLLPLLVYLFADGNHLPFVLVPDATLNTNFCDLRGTSNDSFQQEAALFHFDRDSAADVASLRHLFERFTTAIAHKKYFVTTASSMQSLELKYFELLYNRSHPLIPLTEEQKQQSTEQLEWLSKILNLIQKQGVAAIDEAHLLLHIRKELNYAIGKQKRIDFNTVDMITALYAWMAAQELALNPQQTLSLRQLLQNPNQVADEAAITDLMKRYVQALCSPKNKPFWMKTLLVNSLTDKNLEQFLLGELNPPQEQAVYTALEPYPLIKARWLLLREEFSTLLKLTLRNKLHENYGPDLATEPGAPPKPIAVPYRANKTPTPFAFANFLEAFNYTSQMLYCDGISFDYFRDLLRSWQSAIRDERQDTPAGEMSPTEQKFNLIFAAENLSLLTLDLDSKVVDANQKTLLQRLHEKYTNNGFLVNQVLKDSLSTMTIDEAILRCDSLDLASLFGRVFAFSATPNNHRSFHPNVEMLYRTSFLIENQVKDYLKEKKTEIIECPAVTPDDFLDAIIDHKEEKRVLLDCGSRLRGLSGFEVAQKIALRCQQRAAQGQKPLRYVLFYQGDALYAWKVQPNGNYKDQVPQKLSNTKPDIIEKELDGCKPEERYTYYDQDHNVGVDIKQGAQTVGEVTVDLKTTQSAFSQAVMRLRELGLEQRVIINLDPAVMALVKKCQVQQVPPIDLLDALYDFLKNNQKTQLEMEHFQAGLKMIRKIFREKLKALLLEEQSPEQRDKRYLAFESFFIEPQTDDIVKLYQHKATTLETATIFNDYSQTQERLWSDCLLKAGFPDADIAKRALEIKEPVKKICEQAVLICATQQMYPAFQGEKEVQQQKEQRKETQKQVEKEQLSELATSSLTVNYLDLEWVDRLINSGNLSKYYTEELQPLMARYRQPWELEPELCASSNLLYNYQNQARDDLYNLYTKICTAVLFVRVGNGLQAVMVCPEEADKLQQVLAAPGNARAQQCWLTTLHGQALHTKPVLTALEQEKENPLLEQAAFVNGRADILLTRPASAWLTDGVDKKLQFLREQVKPALGIPEEELTRLEAKLLHLDNFVDQWARHPLDPSFVEAWTHDFSPEVKKRITKLLPVLNNARHSIFATNQKIPLNQLVDLSFHDVLLVEKYQNQLNILYALKIQDWQQAAALFQELHTKVSPGFLNYCFFSTPLPLTTAIVETIYTTLSDSQSQRAWLKQVLGAAATATLISDERFLQYTQEIALTPKNLAEELSAIADYAKRCQWLNRYLVATNAAMLDLPALMKLLVQWGPVFKVEALKEETTLASCLRLMEAGIIEPCYAQQALTDANFRSVLQLLDQHKFLSARMLASLKNTASSALKKRLTTLADYQLMQADYLRCLIQEAPWSIIKQLIDAGLANQQVIIKVLLNVPFQDAMYCLSKSNMLTTDNLTALKDEQTIAAIQLLHSNTIYNPVIIRHALQEPDFCRLLDFLKEKQAPLLSELVLVVFAEEEKAMLAGLQAKLEKPDILEAVTALKDLPLEEKSLIKQAITDPEFPFVVNYVTGLGLSGNTLPLVFLNRCKATPQEARKILALLEKYQLNTADNIKALEQEKNWQHLLTLCQTTVTDKATVELGLNIQELMQAQNVLKTCGINDATLLKDLETEAPLRKALAAYDQPPSAGKAALLTAWTIQAIQAINQVRAKYVSDRYYNKIMPTIHDFSKKAIAIFIAHNQAVQPAAAEEIVKELKAAASKHFKHRHLAVRILGDVLLALTIVGLLVNLGRKLSGKSFFFSKATTQRQDNFEQAVVPRLTSAA